jgi:hypothetical protein
LTVLEPEGMYPDTALEQGILGPDVEIIQGGAPHTASLDVLPDELCAKVDGLLIFRHWLRPHHLDRFPKLRSWCGWASAMTGCTARPARRAASPSATCPITGRWRSRTTPSPSR